MSNRKAPRAQTNLTTHRPFANLAKAVSRFAECIPAPGSAGCGKGASFVDFSFAGKKSRKRDEWAFHHERSNFSIRRKETFPHSTAIQTENHPCGSNSSGRAAIFMRAPQGASGLVPASTRPAPRSLTHSSTAHHPFGDQPKAVVPQTKRGHA